MKNKYIKLLPIALSAALLFTGCAAGQVGASAADTTASEEVITQTVSNVSALSSQSSAASTTTESDACTEAFSARDLSGEYDTAEAVAITLNGSSAASDSDSVQISGSTVTITAAGTYILSGELDNGSVIVNVSEQDRVQLVLNGVGIHSDTFAALYVVQADKVFVTLADGTTNSLSNGGSFVLLDENNVDAVVYAKDDITFNGTGTLEISSPAGHGIVGKDEVTITDGVYEIVAADSAICAKDSIAIADGSFTLTTGGDGLHAENNDDDTLGSIYIADGTFTIQAVDDAVHATTLLQIDGGSLNITAAEGLEATYLQINDGEIDISASDDGVNAGRKSSAYTPTVEINGGTLTIVMGAGDTDAVDANGNIIINGGTVNITSQSSFDCDGTAQYNGGTIIINGQTVNAIPNQMMRGGMGGHGGMNGSGRRGW